MARVLAFDESSSASDGETPAPPPPAQQPAPAAYERAGATSRPLKRVARFLGDDGSDDDDDNDAGYSAAAYGSARAGASSSSRRDLAAGLGKKKKTTATDVDRMFADLEKDEDDDDGLGIPLAQRNINANATQNSIIDDNIAAFANGDAPDDKIDAEKTKKPKRKPVVMNEERLLGDKGIRRLKENLKGFKIKGKGHEEDDLRRLMNVYQLWAHQMYPAGSFKDTITQVERLCKKRSVKSIMKGWRDKASGKLPPPLAGRDDSDAEDGPTRHANSDEDDVRDVLAYQGQTTTSQAGSPERQAPKKSYFDDIPTSSPGGALSRDAEMADDDDLAESLFGTAPRHEQLSQAGPSTSRAVPSADAAVRMTTSEAGFNDADLTFELEEVDDFDMDAEAEAAMREMMDQNDMDDDFFNPGPTKGNKGKQPETGASKSASTVKPNAAISFYAEPKAVERAKIGKTLVEEAHRQVPSSSPAPKRHEAEMAGEENFDDFDFGAEEDDIMREMEAAEKKRKDREAAALAPEKRASSSSVQATVADIAASGSELITTSSSKTPSLTASSSAQDVDLDLDDAFEEDEQFLRSMEVAELASSQKQASQGIAADSVKQMSPIRASSPLKTPSAVSQEPHVVVAETEEAAILGEEEEEDLYS